MLWTDKNGCPKLRRPRLSEGRTAKRYLSSKINKL